MAVKTRIFLDNFQKTVTKHTSATRRSAFLNLKEKVQLLRENLISEFSSHGVTKELQEHNEGSAYLSGKSHGTLFGFIGFDAGYDAISPVLEELERIFVENNPQDLPVTQKGRLGYKFSVNIPLKKDFDRSAPMPKWASGSWIYAIENGISGLNYYLGIFGTPNSYSKEGVQSVKEIKSIQYKGVDRYLPTMLKDFRAALKMIDNVE